MVHLNPISYVLFLAALLLASLQLVVWQRRKGIQTILFALLMTLTIVWLLTYGMELSAPDTPSAVTCQAGIHLDLLHRHVVDPLRAGLP